MPLCNGDTFQIFLDQFSNVNPTELKLVVLDNGVFHKAKTLLIPQNIILIFLLPYSPELNPAEKIWQKFKRTFSNQFFKTIEEPDTFICEISNELNKDQVKSICSFKYILVCLIFIIGISCIYLSSFWSI